FFSGQVCASAAGAAIRHRAASSLLMVGYLFVFRSVPETARAASRRRSSPDRKTDLGDQAAPFARQEIEPAAVRAHHALDYRETEPGAAVVAPRDLQAREGLLQALGLGSRNAGAAIGHVE